MTEEQWLQCADPKAMLALLRSTGRGYISYRKLRLLIVAYGRTDLNRLATSNQRAFQVAERFADGQATREELLQAFEMAWGGEPDDFWMHTVSEHCAPLATKYHIIRAADEWIESYSLDASYSSDASRRKAAHLIREIFGNPFSPVTFDSNWLTTTVVALAHGIYEDQAFGTLPILADALKNEGCPDGAVLLHCREDGPHIRGCWVVDLLLRKR